MGTFSNAFALIFCLVNAFFASSVPLNATHWLLNCGSDGIKMCNSSDPDLSVYNQNLNISNCYFINCPLIALTGASIQVVNVTFQSSHGQNAGGAFSFINSIGTFRNVVFTSCSAPRAGAIYFEGGSSLTFIDVHFYQNQATYDHGGAIYGANSQFTCTNCTFLENYAANTGSSFLMTDSSYFNMTGGYMQNQSSGVWAAGFYLAGNSMGNVSQVLFKNLSSGSGTVVFMSDHNQLAMSDIVVQNAVAGSQGGFVYMWDTGALWCYRCNLTDLQSQWVGGVGVPQKNSQIHFYNSYISNVYSASLGAFYIITNGIVSLNDGTIIENTTSTFGSIASLSDTSNFTCKNSIIRNGLSWSGGGCLDVGVADFVVIDSCTITNCKTGALGIGGMARNMGILVLQNSSISDVSANSGGTVFATGNSVTWLEKVQIWDSTAATCGGVIYSDTSSAVIFAGNELQISAADTSTPSGKFLCFQQSNMNLLQYIGNLSTLNINGSIWIEDVAASEWFIKHLAHLFASALPVQGSASRIAWNSNPILPSRGLRPEEVIPPFSVRITDRFGELPPFSWQRIAVVQATSSSGILVGETIKAWVDATTGDIKFQDLKITNVTPGLYEISVIPVGGTLNTLANDTFPSFELRIAVCESNERFSPSQGCIPTKEISEATRIVMAVLGALLFIITCLCSLGIYAYRDFRVVKGSAPLFLAIMNAGIIEMSIALLVGVSTDDSGCIARAWFENLGFLTIFVPLILKTKRIQFIFQREFGSTKKHGSRLKNVYLLKNLGLTAFAAIAAMILWTVLAPPHIEEPTFYNSYVSVGSCETTTGDLIAICIQIVVLLYAVQLAFSVRDAPANFNESKVIVFATYNWAVFIGIGIAVSEFAIQDPQVAFIISSISIFIPSLTHTLLLTGYKVYLCVIDPETANMKIDTYGNGGNSDSNKGKSVSTGGENNKVLEITQSPRGGDVESSRREQQFTFERSKAEAVEKEGEKEVVNKAVDKDPLWVS